MKASLLALWDETLNTPRLIFTFLFALSILNFRFYLL